MRTRAAMAMACAALLGPACARPVPAPSPSTVSPASVRVGESLELVIRGEHFLPEVVADFASPDRSEVDETFEVRLGSAALLNVTLVSTTELHASIPAGLPPGRYDLTVRSARGEGVLSGAFHVLGPPPEEVVFVTPPRTSAAGACSEAITLELRDASGTATTADGTLPVALSVAPADFGALFEDPACSAPTGTAVFELGQSSRTVYARGTIAGVGELGATADGLRATVQHFGVVPAATTRWVWAPISSPQLRGDPFGAHAHSEDAFGNATALTQTVALTTAPAVPIRCTSGCDASGSAQFVDGAFAGAIAIDAAATGISLVLSDGAFSSGSNPFDVRERDPVALGFSTPARTLTAGACSDAVVVELRDAEGLGAIAVQPIALQVQLSGVAGFADSGCTQPLETPTIGSGGSSLSFHLRGTVAGGGAVSVTSQDLSGADQGVTVTAGATAAFRWEPIGTPRTTGAVFAVQATAVDAFGNATRFNGAAALSAKPSTPITCSSGCTGGNAELADGVFTGLVSVDALRTSVQLQLTAGAVTGTSNAFAVGAPPADPPAALAFASPPRSVIAAECSEPVVVELRDSTGQSTAAMASTPVMLGVSPSNAIALYSDAACTAPLGSLSFAAGQSQRVFHFSGLTARSVDLTASSGSLTPATQTQQIVGAAFITLSWNPTPTSVRRGADFAVTIRALDAYGNVAPAFSGTATFSVSSGSALFCSSGCSAPDTTAAFSGGVWGGHLRLGTPTGMDRIVTATSGAYQGSSNPIDIVDPSGTPPTARLTRSPAVIRAGESVSFDASGSTDVETSSTSLRFAFDPTGTAPAPPPWPSWSSSATFSHTYATPGLYRARVAVRDLADKVGFEEVDVLVIDAATTLCVVNDADGSDEGPASCNTANLSLVEAIRISNSTPGKQVITFTPGLAMSFSNVLTVSDSVDIVAPSNVTAANMGWNFTGGTVLLSSLALSGGSKDFGDVTGGVVRLSDVQITGYQSLDHDGGLLSLQGVRWLNCTDACITVDVGAGAFLVRDSFFKNVSGNAINLHDCSAAREIRSSVFKTMTKGIHVKNSCSGTVVVANNTFDDLDSGVYFDAGFDHVLVNNVFVANSSGPIRGCTTPFAQRSHNLIFNSDVDGCTTADPGAVLADPQFISSSTDDYRLLFTSPARDSGLRSGHDVTPGAPGEFLGLAPDRGGRETW